MPSAPTTNWWRIPPLTAEAQLDELHSFVHTKQHHLQPGQSKAQRKGECWDHVAFDPEHRLVLEQTSGRRSVKSYERLLLGLAKRTRLSLALLLIGDEFPKLKTAAKKVFASDERVALMTLVKEYEGKRVVKVDYELVLGSMEVVDAVTGREGRASQWLNTSFVERRHGTARSQNSRQVRSTLGFSKEWETHRAVSAYVGYSYNFCWAVRTLKGTLPGVQGPVTPAMAAQLTSHRWSLAEWCTFVPRPA